MGNLLDKLFEDKLKSRKPAFEQEDWVKMEALLESRATRRRIIPIWLSIVLGVFILFIIVGGVFFLVNDIDPKNDNLALIETSHDNPISVADKHTEIAVTNNLSTIQVEPQKPIDYRSIHSTSISSEDASSIKTFDSNTDNEQHIASEVEVNNSNEQELYFDSSEKSNGLSDQFLILEDIQFLALRKSNLIRQDKTSSRKPGVHVNKPVQDVKLRPEFGFSAGFMTNGEINLYEIGLFKSIGIHSNWSVGVQALYNYINFEPFVLAQEIGNIYSFDVSNYSQELIAQKAHGLSGDIFIAYHFGSSSLSVSLCERYLFALKSDRVFESVDAESQIDQVWTDRDLFDAWQLSTKISYEYKIFKSLRVGGFYNYQLGENKSFALNNNFGINLKWSL